MSGFMSGFIFRPYIFFIIVGLVLFLIALYVIGWIFINTFYVYPNVQTLVNILTRDFHLLFLKFLDRAPRHLLLVVLPLLLRFNF